MSKVILNIDNYHLDTFLNFLHTLSYVKVKKVEDDRSAEEIIDDLLPSHTMRKKEFKAIKLNTIGFKFNREEANER